MLSKKEEPMRVFASALRVFFAKKDKNFKISEKYTIFCAIIQASKFASKDLRAQYFTVRVFAKAKVAAKPQEREAQTSTV